MAIGAAVASSRGRSVSVHGLGRPGRTILDRRPISLPSKVTRPGRPNCIRLWRVHRGSRCQGICRGRWPSIEFFKFPIAGWTGESEGRIASQRIAAHQSAPNPRAPPLRLSSARQGTTSHWTLGWASRPQPRPVTGWKLELLQATTSANVPLTQALDPSVHPMATTHTPLQPRRPTVTAQ